MLFKPNESEVFRKEGDTDARRFVTDREITRSCRTPFENDGGKRRWRPRLMLLEEISVLEENKISYGCGLDGHLSGDRKCPARASL